MTAHASAAYATAVPETPADQTTPSRLTRQPRYQENQQHYPKSQKIKIQKLTPTENPVQQPTAHPRQTIDALAQSIDQAMELLRRGRYAELDSHFQGFAQQALRLEALKQALENGSPPAAGLRESCDHLGHRLVVFSELARQVAAIESGVMELIAGPRDHAYGRDGQCENGAAARFEQEA
jgi:hypothetical protein